MNRLIAQKHVQEIQDLLDRGFYSMAFQPIRRIATGTAYAYEALLRGPKGTPLASPGRLFHEPGYIPRDLLFRLDSACFHAAIRTSRLLPPQSRVFINIHGETLWQLARKSRDVFPLLEMARVSPSRIVLEIAETTSRTHLRAIGKSLEVFRQEGVRVALDDLGASYPWLHHILWLQPDYIKLDRVFINRIDQDARKQDLVCGLIEFARTLDAEVIVEGVETQEQLETLDSLGVRFAQGYHLGRPMGAEKWSRKEGVPPGQEPLNLAVCY